MNNIYSKLRPFITVSLGLILVIALAGCAQSPTETVERTTTKQVVPAKSTTDTSADSEELTKKIDGIEATVSNIRMDGADTLINVIFSNHLYDISSMDVQGLSSLNGVTPTDYVIKNTKMGGHHVEAEMRFPTKSEGALILGLNADIVFAFQL